jgi:trehalose-phosphatase
MMAPRLREVERDVLAELGAASSVFCFVDYDGTLSPLAPTPDVAVPLPGTAELLCELVQAPRTHVALVSGRAIADMRRFLDVPGVHYVGIHGLEIGPPNGEAQMAAGVALVRSILPAIKRRLEHALGTRPGILIEDKGATLACHYRLASPADGMTARQTLAGMVRAYQRRGVSLRLVYGHEVAEVRPVHVNKGKTACALLAVHAPTALPVYIGDDQTDEDAFKLLPAHAVTVRVGPPDEPTHARYRVTTPDEVQHFLRALLDARLGRIPVPREHSSAHV